MMTFGRHKEQITILFLLLRVWRLDYSSLSLIILKLDFIEFTIDSAGSLYTLFTSSTLGTWYHRFGFIDCYLRSDCLEMLRLCGRGFFPGTMFFTKQWMMCFHHFILHFSSSASKCYSQSYDFCSKGKKGIN